MKVIVWWGLALLFSFGVHARDAINFAVIGDYGMNNDAEARVAELVKRNQPQFILTVGDNNYPDGCKDTIDVNIGKYYHDYIFNYQGSFGSGAVNRKFLPTLGNHDWYALEKCLEQKTLPYLLYFDLPGNERYYDFVEGPVHFFALDSDIREPDGNKRFLPQYRWLRERSRASNAPFKVAYFHHPPFSSGEHGNAIDMQWDFHKLDIDVVIAGHDHNYERIAKNGIVYIVNGLGGARPRSLKKKVAGSKFFYAEKHGALFIEATNEKMHLRFKNYDDVLIDEYVVNKTAQQNSDDVVKQSPPRLPCLQTCAH